MIKVQGDGVREKKSKNFELTFTIPQDAACSNENFTEIFQISYELEVDAITAGCHFDINIAIPLTIGTIPLTGFGIDDHTRVPNPASHLISTDMNDASPAYSTIPSAPMSDLRKSLKLITELFIGIFVHSAFFRRSDEKLKHRKYYQWNSK